MKTQRTKSESGGLHRRGRRPSVPEAETSDAKQRVLPPRDPAGAVPIENGRRQGFSKQPSAAPSAAVPAEHADQLDEVFAAHGLPLQIQPRKNHERKEDRDADWKACRAELRAVAAELRDAQNAMVFRWLEHHLIGGLTVAGRRNAPGGEAVPTELFLAMYHAAKPCFALAAGDVQTCALNWLVATIKNQRSPNSNLKRWQTVLMLRRRQRPWHWDSPQPIRLSAKTAKIERVGGELHLVVRVVKGAEPIRCLIKSRVATERILRPEGPGQNGKKFNARLDKLNASLALKGALLQEERNGWELKFLSREVAPRLPVDDNLETMFVRTSNEAGWRIRWRGRSAFLVGGEQLADLANVRREQIARRSEMKERGIDSRTAEAQGMKDRWANYCRTLYQQTAAEIVAWCVKHGVRRVAVMAGDEWCALGQVGNDDQRKSEPTRFPFAGFARQLKENAMRRGIIVVSRPNLRSVKRRKEVWEKKMQRSR